MLTWKTGPSFLFLHSDYTTWLERIASLLIFLLNIYLQPNQSSAATLWLKKQNFKKLVLLKWSGDQSLHSRFLPQLTWNWRTSLILQLMPCPTSVKKRQAKPSQPFKDRWLLWLIQSKAQKPFENLPCNAFPIQVFQDPSTVSVNMPISSFTLFKSLIKTQFIFCAWSPHIVS